MTIYTRTGDDGTTALFGGTRVLKCEELVDVYGSIDELNSWVGLIATQITDEDTKSFLQDIQADLFVIGSMFAGWKKGGAQNLTNKFYITGWDRACFICPSCPCNRPEGRASDCETQRDTRQSRCPVGAFDSA